jgi:hypothetical protein
MKSICRNKRIKILTCLLVTGVAWFLSLYLSSSPVSANPNAEPKPTPRKAKYSEFPHSEKAHKLVCSACHKFPSDNWNKVRTGDEAFPDVTEYPKHQSCLTCHKQQFFKGTPPKICSICHTNPSAGDSSRHPFPNPREIFDKSKKGETAESDFVIGFPHDKHIEIVSRYGSRASGFVKVGFATNDRRRAGEESCSVCHQTRMPQGESDVEFVAPPPATLGDGFWLKKGTFKTSPIGHKTCFTCHSADMGILPAPESCSGCHQLKPNQPAADFDVKSAAAMKIEDKVIMDSWRRRDSAGTFRHEFIAHVDLDCSTCHSVTTINTADPLTMKVNISSCAICHVTTTTDDGGALNYEIDRRKADAKFQCVKCHMTFGKLGVPTSHSNAILAAAAK